MMQDVVPSDIALFAIEHVRAVMGAEFAYIGNVEPDDLPARLPALVIRDDGGPGAELALFQVSLGVTVLGGTRRNTYAIGRLAARVFGLLTNPGIAAMPGPVASVERDDSYLPVQVRDEADIARFYAQVGWRVLGTI